MADTPTPIAEIDHGPSKFDEFLENNQKKLVILAIAIFLGVLAFVFMKGYNSMQEEKAGALLSEAKTEEDYNKVITEYPDRAAAGTAAYNIATMRTSDTDAIDALNFFLSTYPDHTLVPQAEFNLAQRQINANKIQDAKTTLENLIDNENAAFIIPRAMISLGDLAVDSGDKEQAEKFYNDAVNYNQSNHQFVIEAKTKIDYINASKPTLVEAPVQPIEPITPQEVEPVKELALPGSEPSPIAPTEPVQPQAPQQP